VRNAEARPSSSLSFGAWRGAGGADSRVPWTALVTFHGLHWLLFVVFGSLHSPPDAIYVVRYSPEQGLAAPCHLK
jgi:hypothetical protein